MKTVDIKLVKEILKMENPTDQDMVELKEFLYEKKMDVAQPLVMKVVEYVNKIEGMQPEVKELPAGYYYCDKCGRLGWIKRGYQIEGKIYGPICGPRILRALSVKGLVKEPAEVQMYNWKLEREMKEQEEQLKSILREVFNNSKGTRMGVSGQRIFVKHNPKPEICSVCKADSCHGCEVRVLEQEA